CRADSSRARSRFARKPQTSHLPVSYSSGVSLSRFDELDGPWPPCQCFAAALALRERPTSIRLSFLLGHCERLRVRSLCQSRPHTRLECVIAPLRGIQLAVSQEVWGDASRA